MVGGPVTISGASCGAIFNWVKWTKNDRQWNRVCLLRDLPLGCRHWSCLEAAVMHHSFKGSMKWMQGGNTWRV